MLFITRQTINGACMIEYHFYGIHCSLKSIFQHEMVFIRMWSYEIGSFLTLLFTANTTSFFVLLNIEKHISVSFDYLVSCILLSDEFIRMKQNIHSLR